MKTEPKSAEPRAVVLIVDDTPTNLEVLQQTLSDDGFKVLVAIDGEGALEQAEYTQPDLILLDVMMPELDGFETCRRLKASSETRDIPVIFMTALSETVDKVRGFELGAVDYITKPFQQKEVSVRVATHVTLRKLQQQLQRANEWLDERVIERTVDLAETNARLRTEIRTRERFKDAWATNVFRPFPTAGILAAAIKGRRADWQATPALATLVTSLEDMTTLTPKRLGSPAFDDMVVLQGSVDAPLPAIGDDALTRDLLTSTAFVSAYGTAWKASGAAKAFGPTGPASGLSVVPARFDSGLLEVREKTCSKCHDQGGWFIGSLVDDAVLYGDVWGVDRIFSFYPFDPSRIEASGNENRVVRPAFAQGAVFERYDAAKHSAERYTFYKPQP